MRRALGGAYLDAGEAARDWKSAFAVGAILIALGLAAILFPFTAALATELVIGTVLVVAGAFEVIAGARSRDREGRLWLVFLGLAAIAAGGLLLAFPLAGILSLAFVVGVLLVAQGVIRVLYAWRRWRVPGAGWWLSGGTLAVLLGGLILLLWPGIAPWLLGVLVGVDLIVSGWRNIAVAMAAWRAAAH